jgi:hypothetical protein
MVKPFLPSLRDLYNLNCNARLRVLAVNSLPFLLHILRYLRLLNDGSRTKKSLSERVHHDVTGIKMHRDLMSAYLSRYVNQDDRLSLQDARNGYRGAESLLTEAWQESINRERLGSSESGLIVPERFSDKLKKVDQIADCKQSERKVNPNSQPESASRSVRGVAQLIIMWMP